LRKTLHKQTTNKQTNRHYENNGHLAVNQLWLGLVLTLQASSTQKSNETERPYLLT